MTANTAASVHQRLLNLARAEGRRFNDLLQHYALERWLYRLSQSTHRDRFILKGALMLVAWELPMARPTRDIDFLVRAENSLDIIAGMIADICVADAVDDGMMYDAASIKTSRIVEDAMYAGVRATFNGSLGRAKARMQVDAGFSDTVTPGPVEIVYPTALEYPAPRLRAYNRETAIAEKFEAMVKLGDVNGRMKDFFDIWMLATNQGFEGSALAASITHTFERRGTKLEADAACFREGFASSEDKQIQWKAFIERAALGAIAPSSFAHVWRVVIDFLKRMAVGDPGALRWQPGGPWTAR